MLAISIARPTDSEQRISVFFCRIVDRYVLSVESEFTPISVYIERNNPSTPSQLIADMCITGLFRYIFLRKSILLDIVSEFCADSTS